MTQSTINRNYKVAVLQRGMSAEKDVSEESGNQVAKALKTLGYQVVQLDAQADIAQKLAQQKPDVVFNALHGQYGEDGCIAGLLEVMGIAYTHSGVLASAIAMHKTMAKQVFSHAGIQCPQGKEYTPDELLALIESGEDEAWRPYVMKPVSEGSSVGVHIIREKAQHVANIVQEWQYGQTILVEQFIEGKEIAVSIVEDKAIGITELHPKVGFYNYEAKYTDGLTEHYIPARVPDAVIAKAYEVAEHAHHVLGCKSISRADFRYDDTKGVDGLYLLEVNTHPGLTPLSILPEAAMHHNISFESLIDGLVQQALQQ